MDLLVLAPLSGVLALFFAWFLGVSISKKDPGNERMKAIMGFIHEGAMAFLFREYKVLAIFVIVLAIIIGIFLKSWLTAICFIIGACCSVLAGFFWNASSDKSKCQNSQRSTERSE